MEMKGRLDGILRRKVDLIANDSEKKNQIPSLCVCRRGPSAGKGWELFEKKRIRMGEFASLSSLLATL